MIWAEDRGLDLSRDSPNRCPCAIRGALHDLLCQSSGDGTSGDYLTDALTTGAIRFLRERDDQRPFLLCVGQVLECGRSLPLFLL